MNKIKQVREKIENEYIDYLRYTKSFFQDTHGSMTVENHSRHNIDPEYQKYIIEYVSKNKEFWSGKKALDIGCGCGRNVANLLSAADFKRVDGCDISLSNVEYSKKYVNNPNSNFWETDGYTLNPAKNNEYDYIMSHIVFQHIANHSIRYSLLSDVYRILNDEGTAIIHYLDLGRYVPYYEDYSNCEALLNCTVGDESYLIKDFEEIGFKNVEVFTGTDPFCTKKSYYVRGKK
jgi:2-polyprenyl-3-methyl-5-hydroxy-6-metoxy-1,4-benzoquinol methylase